MIITRQQLLLELYQAFYDARRGKRNRSYVRKWEGNLRENMELLCDDLYNRTYEAEPSKCFIVNYPKKREIFAAGFRDRIVHHLYFNYTHELFERTFIADSYSCIKGRGAHYGVARVRDFCRKASHNWQDKCYVLHLDVRGYFMHIDRQRLLDVALVTLRRMAPHKVDGVRWGERLDMDLIEWLTEKIVMVDPRRSCIVCGDASDWDGLDPAKSMLNLRDGLGLPIGNLTSQLFSNVYLNVLDQYMKRELKCRWYGRYVDDAVVVSADRQWLLGIVPLVRDYLQRELGLELHCGKLELSEVHCGVEFLGAWILPWRTYISRHSVRRMQQKISEIDYSRPRSVVRSVNSYLGIMAHMSSYRLRHQLLVTPRTLRYGMFDENLTCFSGRRQRKPRR